MVISGVAVSGALGVPVGTLAGQALGWRGSFTAAVVLAVAALVATVALVPSVPSTGGSAGSQARHAFAPRVLAVLAVTFLVFASVYAALTYIVPFLQTVTGISGGLISVFLLAYGGAAALGSFGGGRFADVNAGRTLMVGTIGVAVSLLALYLLGAVAVLAWRWRCWPRAGSPWAWHRHCSIGWSAWPVPVARWPQSLPASAANVGIAFGSFAGGVAVGSFTASAAVIAGLVIAVIAIPAAWATSFLKPPTVGAATQPAEVPEPALSAA